MIGMDNDFGIHEDMVGYLRYTLCICIIWMPGWDMEDFGNYNQSILFRQCIQVKSIQFIYHVPQDFSR